MEDNYSNNIIIIKYCLPITAVSFIIFICGFFCDEVLKTSLWSAAVFAILASLVIYCFTAESVTNDNVEEIEYLKEEGKILSELHYNLHLINPEMKLKDKVFFSLRLLTENIPESTFVFYSCYDKDFNFIAASRLNSRKQVERLFPEDPLIGEITNKIKSLTDYESLQKTGGLEKPLIISSGLHIQGQILTVDFYTNVLGIIVEIGKTKLNDLENKILSEFCKSLALIIEDNISFENQAKSIIESTEVKTDDELDKFSQELYDLMFPKLLPTMPNWDLSEYHQASKNNQADFMDIISLNSSKQMILLGKCSGHGINAASYVNKLKVILRCFISEYQTPSQLLNKVSVYLNTDLMPDIFVDVTALMFSSTESKITVAIAGNTLPIINRTRSGFAEIPELTTGIPLGLFNQGTQPYKDQYINIMPGDGIVLHTDGITDFPGEKIERLSNEDLKNILDKLPEQNADKMLDSLVKQIKKSNFSELPKEDHSIIYLKSE